MSRRAAIIGAGRTGGLWLRRFHAAGWEVRYFDPDPGADGIPTKTGDWSRRDTISDTVAGASCVIVALPERLDLMRTVIQRAQAAAPRDAVLLSTARTHDVLAVQGCAMRPEQIALVRRGTESALSLDLTPRNAEAMRTVAQGILAEIAAVIGLDETLAEPEGDVVPLEPTRRVQR